MKASAAAAASSAVLYGRSHHSTKHPASVSPCWLNLTQYSLLDMTLRTVGDGSPLVVVARLSLGLIFVTATLISSGQFTIHLSLTL